MKKYVWGGIAAAIVAILIVALVFYPKAQSYFFFQDSDFSIEHLSGIAKWKSFGWNFSDPFNYKIDFGNSSATLFYNESSGENYGGAVLLQGKQPHSQEIGPKILGGTSIDNAKEATYIEFSNSRPIGEGRFFLEAQIMVTARNYTIFNGNPEAVSNVGVDLMFGFDEANYDDTNMTKQVAIHAGILFSRASWNNTTKKINHSNDSSNITPDPNTPDIHITLIKGKIPQLNMWYTFRIDLAEILKTVFNLSNKQNIRFYGVQVYTDGKSSYTQATFDYIRTRFD